MKKNFNFPSRELPGKERIPSIDYFRTFAIFLVIINHTDPLSNALTRYMDGSGSSFLEAAIKFVLGRMRTLAIPFFFMIAGYFFGQKMLSADAPARAAGSYLKRLIIVYVFGNIFYYLLPGPAQIEPIIQHGYLEYLYAGLPDWPGLLLHGTANHLWFISSLILTLCTVAFFVLMNKKGFIMPFAILFYAYCLIESTYSSTPLGAQIHSFLSMQFPGIMQFDAKVNSGYSMIFVACGWYLATKKNEHSLQRSGELIILGVIISCIETYILWKQFGILPVQSVGTVPLVVGLTMYAFSMPDIGRNSFIARCGRYTLGIYLVHYLFVGWLKPMADLIVYPLSDILYPFVVYFLSLLAAVVFSKNKWLRQVVY